MDKNVGGVNASVDEHVNGMRPTRFWPTVGGRVCAGSTGADPIAGYYREKSRRLSTSFRANSSSLAKEMSIEYDTPRVTRTEKEDRTDGPEEV